MTEVRNNKKKGIQKEEHINIANKRYVKVTL